MADFGFHEIMIILVIAVFVIGPNNLPKTVKAVRDLWEKP